MTKSRRDLKKVSLISLKSFTLIFPLKVALISKNQLDLLKVMASIVKRGTKIFKSMTMIKNRLLPKITQKPPHYTHSTP